MGRTPTSHQTLRVVAALWGVVALGTVAACGQGAQKGADGDYPAKLVLADRDSKDDYHPASGYGQTGVSPVYDGLLRPDPVHGPDKLPALVPALAAEAPTPNAAGDQWTVRLREGVKFHDGSDFDAEDVKATYAVASDATKGSKILSRFEVIKAVEVVDSKTVRFDLKYPYGGFLSRLTLAVAPSELVGQGVVGKAELGTRPVGTGPYKMVENSGDRLVFAANDGYWRGVPEVKELVVLNSSDDSARGQRVATGEIDGTSLPPALASSFKKRPGVEVHSVKTADWKGISLPRHAALSDPRVRRALNIGVDRAAVVSGPLKGMATPLESLVAPFYQDAYDPGATFGHDVAAAERLLDEAGWKRGPDGMRAKDGVRFQVTLMYAASDLMRRDMAMEFAAQMKKLGLEFVPEGGTWDEITPRLGQDAAVLGGGASPYDPDLMLYTEYHTRYAGSTEYSNPGNYGSAKMDGLLDAARRETDPAKRNAIYRQVQRQYLEDPASVALATPDHNYVAKPNKWRKPGPLLEPHIHGTTWGPWWDLGGWRR